MSANIKLQQPIGLVLIEQHSFGDQCGVFMETWSQRELSKAGIDVDFVQDNQSWSREAGTLRGLHFQAPPYAQDKLVRCALGKIIDVAVDIRRGSPTYGQWQEVELSPENCNQLVMPKGFLHRFLTLDGGAEVQYNCSDFYAPECDGAVLWESLGIDWPIFCAPILSVKDAGAGPFSVFQSPFFWDEET
jgi:dTDP-4-dehydrorhamnose 3,5-epimerase